MKSYGLDSLKQGENIRNITPNDISTKKAIRGDERMIQQVMTVFIFLVHTIWSREAGPRARHCFHDVSILLQKKQLVSDNSQGILKSSALTQLNDCIF